MPVNNTVGVIWGLVSIQPPFGTLSTDWLKWDNGFVSPEEEMLLRSSCKSLITRHSSDMAPTHSLCLPLNCVWQEPPMDLRVKGHAGSCSRFSDQSFVGAAISWALKELRHCGFRVQQQHDACGQLPQGRWGTLPKSRGRQPRGQAGQGS